MGYSSRVKKLVFALAAGFSMSLAQTPPTPAPDRSGEVAFRAFVRDLGAAKNLSFGISRFSREREDAVLYFDADYHLLWGGGNRFEYDVSDLWSGSRRWVSDGISLLDDPLEGREVTLKDAAKNIYTSSPDFAPRGGYASPLLFLLQGEEAVFKALDPADSIRATSEGFLLGTKAFGDVQIRVGRLGKLRVPTRIAWDNKPYLVEMHKQEPEWYDEPTSPLSVLMIYPAHAKPGKRAFAPIPPGGLTVSDQRKKKL